MNVTIELPDIEGFEIAEGKQPRKPLKGEFYTTFAYSSGIFQAIEKCNEPSIILKKKAPVYRLVGDPTNLAGPKFVELKALKDAMGLVNLIILDLNSDDTAKYHSLMDLIK